MKYKIETHKNSLKVFKLINLIIFKFWINIHTQYFNDKDKYAYLEYYTKKYNCNNN